jgi:2'-5' RNA ligase
VRLFLALEVPSAVREAIWARVARVPGTFLNDRSAMGIRAQKVPGTLVDDFGARWVRPEGLHLTLRFLGEVDAAAMPRLIAACAAAAAGCEPFEAGLEGGGWFPAHGPARALWVGLREDAALGALQARLGEAAGPGSRPADPARPFHAHLTLARCDPPWPRARAEEFAARLGSFADLSFPVTEAALVRSHLERGGSRYEAVARFALALPAIGSGA